MIKAKWRIYARFLFAYLAVIIILVVGTIPVYGHYVANLREKEINKAVYLLETGIGRLEKTIVDISWALTSLEEDFTYRRLTSKSESLTPRELYAAMQVQKSFAIAIRNIDLVDYVFFSFLNNDIILDAERVYRNSDNFYGSFLEYDQQDFTTIDDIKAAANSAILPCQPITIHTRSTVLHGDYMTLLFSDNYGQNTQNTIFAYFDRNVLSTLFLGPDIAEKGALLIEDRNGQEILYSNPQEVRLHPQADNVEYIERNNDLLGLKIRVALPESVYADDLWHTVRNVLLYTFIALFFSTLASFLLAYRNAKPIQNTFQRIVDSGMSTDNDARDAFGFIDRALDAINMDRNKLSMELKSYEKRLRHQTIENLLNGYITYEEDPQSDLRFAPSNRLLLFGASRPDSADRPANDPLSAYGELEAFVSLNLIKNTLPADTIVHETEERDIAVILPAEETTPHDTKAVRAMVESVMEILENKLYLRPRVAISKPFEDPALLSREYTHAKNVLEATLFENTQVIWLPEQEEADAYPDLTPAVINQIYELLMMGAYDRLVLVLESVFSSEVMMSAHFKQAYYSVRGRLLTVYFKAQRDGFDLEIPDYDPKKSNMEQLTELKDSCLLLCQHINSHKVSQNHQLVTDIITYINQNYTDSQLSATMIARRFNISSKYMSQFIKSQTGRMYSEYLESIRLEHALQLLKDPSINVSQIATEVGFANQNTFYKAFRRVYKVSPSTWRNSGGKAEAANPGDE